MRHLPNLITALRIVLVVPMCWLLNAGRYEGALAVATVAGLSDAVDGWMAKQFGWQSWIGGLLDPLADKVLLTAAFIALALAGALPVWLAVLVVGRDLVIVAGALAYHLLIGRLRASPSALSKANTAIQILFVLAQLLRMADWITLSVPVQAGMIVTVATLTIASGLHYVVVWSLRAWHGAAARKEGQ